MHIIHRLDAQNSPCSRPSKRISFPYPRQSQSPTYASKTPSLSVSIFVARFFLDSCWRCCGHFLSHYTKLSFRMKISFLQTFISFRRLIIIPILLSSDLHLKKFRFFLLVYLLSGASELSFNIFSSSLLFFSGTYFPSYSLVFVRICTESSWSHIPLLERDPIQKGT